MYKIFVNKSEYGYVRADLVEKKGGSSSTTTTTTTSTASLPETQVTATEQKSAKVTSESVNVRKGAGTAYDSVGKVKKGDTVTITGEATGTDGKTWYQVTFGANSSTGFVRNDLVAISDGAPAENTENTAPKISFIQRFEKSIPIKCAGIWQILTKNKPKYPKTQSII